MPKINNQRVQQNIQDISNYSKGYDVKKDDLSAKTYVVGQNVFKRAFEGFKSLFGFAKSINPSQSYITKGALSERVGELEAEISGLTDKDKEVAIAQMNPKILSKLKGRLENDLSSDGKRIFERVNSLLKRLETDTKIAGSSAVESVFSESTEVRMSPGKFKEALNNLSLPNSRVYVEGDLVLTEDDYYNSLPNGLTIGGDLKFDIPDDQGVKTLPEGLTVNGNLILDHHSPSKLPENLNVQGNLSLEWSHITEIPESLKFGGDLNCHSCRNLNSVPSWITTLGAKANGDQRVVDLLDTNLSDDLVKELDEGNFTGMEIFISYF